MEKVMDLVRIWFVSGSFFLLRFSTTYWDAKSATLISIINLHQNYYDQITNTKNSHQCNEKLTKRNPAQLSSEFKPTEAIMRTTTKPMRTWILKNTSAKCTVLTVKAMKQKLTLWLNTKKQNKTSVIRSNCVSLIWKEKQHSTMTTRNSQRSWWSLPEERSVWSTVLMAIIQLLGLLAV